MNIKPKLLFLFICLIFNSSLISQIKIKSLPINSGLDSCYELSTTRKVIVLNQNWKVYSEDNPLNKVNTSIPCSFEGTQTLFFEKNFFISKEEYQNYIIKISFLGINNSVEVFINNYNIFKRFGADIPFEIDIPKDIIKPAAENKITLKVTSVYDNESTIPLISGYLLPKKPAGILRSIYLKFIPPTYIADDSFSFSFDDKKNSVNAKLNVELKNIKSLIKTFEVENNTHLEINVHPKNFPSTSQNFIFQLNNKNEGNNSFYFTIQNPALWSPQKPDIYYFTINLYTGGQLVDQIRREIGLVNLENDGILSLNNLPFSIKGTTYFLTDEELLKTSVEEKIYYDLQLIKKTGFNVVRFAKDYPHPYALKLCQQLGLIALIELPLNSAPEELLSSNEFILRAQIKLKDFVQQYRKFSNAIIVGFGSSYLSNSNITKYFFQRLSKIIDNDLLTYASFVGIPDTNFYNINLFGLELYSYPIDSISTLVNRIKYKANKYFISEVNYPNYYGSSSGYLVKNSTEAQAKYFEQFLAVISKTKLIGYVINSLDNYSGNFNSFYAGYNNHYRIGLIDSKQKINSLPYRIVESIQNSKSKITIPIGLKKNENKSFFIFIAIGLSLILGVLINTRRKFKEDCTRALYRPYNFFADIRDHRILSSAYTIILMFVIAGSLSLLLTIILYYLRTNILLEKILLSINNRWLINAISYLAWNPEACFLYLFILIVLKILILSIIIKFISLFLKIKVSFSSIYFSVIWSFFPSVLVIPVELILYRILVMNNFNIFIFVFVFLMFLWIFQRVFKSIHVLFEISSVKVYLYGLSSIIFILGLITIYLQHTKSTIYFIINAIKQYSVLLQ